MGELQETVNTYEVDDHGLALLRAERDGIVYEETDGHDRFRCAEGPFDQYERSLDVRTDEATGRHAVTETVRWQLAIPIWGGLFRRLVARQLRHDQPPEPSRDDDQAPWWSPPARLDARSARVLALLCTMSMLAGYLGTIITQTITFAADEFGASKSAQGTTLSAVRIGILLSLVVVTLSDRKGRKQLLLLSAVGSVAFAAAGALSPNLAVLGLTQTFSRALSTSLALLIAVVAAEEMPAGGRAYAASVVSMTAALGAGGAVLLLPIAGMGGEGSPAWRIVYVVPLLLLPKFLRVARALPESRRFTRPHGKATMAGHRGRLLMLSTGAFLGLLFFAPVTQFQNEFLRTEQGFAAWQITLYTISTGTPGGIGIVVGGRLADLKGRRIVGAVGTIGGAACFALAYQSHGITMWLAAVVGSIVGAMTVPALAVYGPELFPTALRGKANGWITAAGVAGSSVGLYVAGHMADHFDRLGPGIGLLALGPLLVAVLVVTCYPETANVELEELNPEDAAFGFSPPLT